MNDRSQGPAAEKREEILLLFRKSALYLLAFVLILSLLPPGRSFWREMFQSFGFGGSASAPLRIHFLNVGKADAVLLECGGHSALLDAGTSADGETVADYMSRNRIEALDFAIVSHPDKDHMGGMPQVLEEKKCGGFFRSEYFPEAYEPVREVLARKDISETVLCPGNVLELGEARLKVLAPLREYPETNDSSLVLKLEYAGFSVLFCGDIEKDAEKDLVESGAELSADVLKVPHHGSATSCSKSFLKAVSPKYAVISTGWDKSALPKQTVLERLDQTCADVFRTDVDGTVVLSYGQDGLTVKTENEKKERLIYAKAGS